MDTNLDFLINLNSIFTFMTGQNLHGGTVQPRQQWEHVPSVVPKPCRAIPSVTVVAE